MNLTEYLTTLQSAPHGGSGRGISYYAAAATCGRKAVLNEESKEAHQEIEDDGALAIGTLYHLLQEIDGRGQTPTEVFDFSDAAFTPALQEALRLFRGYKAAWGSVGERFGGQIVGAEVAIPATRGGAAAIQAELGGELTGRIDQVLEVYDPEVALENTGLTLERGIYLLDLKTANAMSPQHQWSFQFSLQAAAYMYMYNLDHPQKPCKGFIFDVIAKHKTLRKVADSKGGASFAAYLQRVDDQDPAMLRSLVQLGKRNIEENIANPASCMSGFSPCRHFLSGKCSRT